MKGDRCRHARAPDPDVTVFPRLIHVNVNRIARP
jgi:hypothetical protein